MILDVDETTRTVRVSEYSPIELALLRGGSERTAIDHARRFYDLDRGTARLLVRAVREGEEVDSE